MTMHPESPSQAERSLASELRKVLARQAPDVSRDFGGLNPDLFVLPQHMLCGETTIKRILDIISHARVPLGRKIELIDRYDFWPFLNASRLTPEFRLFIDMSDDLNALCLYKIDSTLTAEELNGACNLSGHDLTLLARIPQPHLMLSSNAIHRYADKSDSEMLIQLFTWGKRISRYRGVTVTWDQAVDRRVWTTNIDTVYLLNRLFEDGIFERVDIGKAMEVGVGGGAIAKTLLTYLPALEELTVTDISPYALACAKRNLAPVRRPEQRLHLYLGKGIRSISARVDLLVVNPPYIPHIQKPDAVDPYRGTGLIQEILTIGQHYLNPDNPDAAIYMGVSSLAARDVEVYRQANPGLRVETIGTPQDVPLKILHVNEQQAWIRFLEQEHGLIRSPERLDTEGFEFWHTLSVLKITPSANVL